MWQAALEQALPTKQRPAIIGAFSQYLAALVASNRLEDGARWARARQMAGDNSPELSMIVDLLETAHASHSQFESALSTVSGLRNSAPDSLLLALTDSTLRYFALSQGYQPAEAVLIAFGQRHSHDPRIQRAIQFHRWVLDSWATRPARAKRSTQPTVHVTASRTGGTTDIGLAGNNARHPQNHHYDPALCTKRHGEVAATPVVRVMPRLLPKAKPAPRADNVATAKPLSKQLAHKAQLAELKAGAGISIAGTSSTPPVRDIARLRALYGGKVTDWFKVSSRSHTAADGSKSETHGYWNASTKQLVEPKIVTIGTP